MLLNSPYAAKAVLIACSLCVVEVGCRKAVEPADPVDAAKAQVYLDVLKVYGEAVFQHGMDDYGTPTPLFIDGVNLDSLEPVKWQYDDWEWTLANLANQQNLLRTFVGMTELMGDPRYRAAAEDAMHFGLNDLITPNGLIYWGGHTAYDAAGDEWVGRRYHWLGKKRNPVHELKANYPFYDLMWELDPDATRRFVHIFWEAHMQDWARLDFDRHGGVVKPKLGDDGSVWDHEFDEDSPVGYVGIGRTFANAGSDLIFAAGMLYELDGDKDALKWAIRLAGQYAKTRNPETGLRGYQFSRPGNDRAESQFGDLFPGKTVDEANLFEPNHLASPLLAQLRLAERLGKKGEPFLNWVIEDLEGMGKSSYDDSTGKFRKTLLDGTNLSETSMPRDGYFGPKGSVAGQWPAQDYLIVYAAAARLADREAHPQLWELARKISLSYDLGDIGTEPGKGRALNFDTDSSNQEFIFALLDLEKITGDRQFLDLACKVADNIVTERFEKGFFTHPGDYQYTRVSRPESMALLHLAGRLMNQRHRLPAFLDSSPYFACERKRTDKSYVFDHNVIYSQPRKHNDSVTQPGDS